MEDAATAEISRAQVWQWIHHGARLDDTDAVVTPELLRSVVDEELARLTTTLGAARFATGRFSQARSLFLELATAGTLADFLTSAAYRALDDSPPIVID
jgi:malate synthase